VPECLRKDIESSLARLGRSNVLADVPRSTQTQFGSGSFKAVTEDTGICNETVCAWLGAAEHGDPAAMQSLRDLHARYLGNAEVDFDLVDAYINIY
jgi:hypothetical protein